MTYQDIIDWLQRMEGDGYNTREQVEEYIMRHQEGMIYHQQKDALDFYFGAEEPETSTRSEEVLEQIKEGEVSNRELEREVEPQVEPEPSAPLPPEVIPETEAERKSITRRIFDRIRGVFG